MVAENRHQRDARIQAFHVGKEMARPMVLVRAVADQVAAQQGEGRPLGKGMLRQLMQLIGIGLRIAEDDEAKGRIAVNRVPNV